jgi:hypothetical protein
MLPLASLIVPHNCMADAFFVGYKGGGIYWLADQSLTDLLWACG